ncbi:hypothetical protein [Acidisoma sp. S159]|uniref:hypothetical protein n=1 Tax=Acidisoma sp. S159 TaxID=1747225 RepID=UPI00131E6AC4|nr:hypothetical protein [Acidisoma sp. S159]
MNTNLVFARRKRYGEEPDAGAPQLVPLVVTPDQPVTAPCSLTADLIEIDLPRGYRIRISGNIKASTLRVLLHVLDRRGLHSQRAWVYGWRSGGRMYVAA